MRSVFGQSLSPEASESAYPRHWMRISSGVLLSGHVLIRGALLVYWLQDFPELQLNVSNIALCSFIYSVIFWVFLSWWQHSASFALTLPFAGLVGMPLVTIVLAVFGAPPLSYGTIELSMLLSGLIMLPAISTGFVEELLGRKAPVAQDQMHLLARIAPIFVIVATWFSSAIVMLDWERSWQIWPVPAVLGALVGEVLGGVASLGVCCVSARIKTD